MTPTPTQIAEWRIKAETAWIVSSGTDAMFSNKGNFESGYIYAKTEQSAEIAHLVESLHSATNLGVVWATEIAELIQLSASNTNLSNYQKKFLNTLKLTMSTHP